MKMIKKLLLFGLVFAATDMSADVSSVSTATFTVENMTCVTCPLTVRKAMQRVKGVSEVHVDFDSKSATVTYDPSLTTEQQIADASNNVGFPARIKEKSTQ